ncbi:unnamed protein product [Paramecium primaurelia]|uniref:VWFA domain-containing protein n=1 Tax=Paramecium primaurelia TaxID=5886 RepID=A0A8S1N5V9_PARPR|nr:unnamed protein product [Paramecium primaurelia]
MKSKQPHMNQRNQQQFQIQQQQIQQQNLFYDEDKSLNVQLLRTLKQPPHQIRQNNIDINFHLNQLKKNPFQNSNQQKVNHFKIGHRQIKQSQQSASSVRRDMNNNNNNNNQLIEQIKNQYYSPQQQNVQITPYKLIQQSHNNQMSQFSRNINNNNIQLDQFIPQIRDQSPQLDFNQLFSRTNQNLFRYSELRKRKQQLLEEIQIKTETIFDNDEYIAPQENQINKNLSNNDLSSKVSFEIKCLQKTCKLKNEESQQLPAMISIKTQEIDSIETERRVGVDLICLIDRSGSMLRQKINMVQQTLLILLNFLSDQDRLQLIIFNESAEQLTPLKCVTEQNKEYFKSIINSITAQGLTRISAATNLAFQQLNNRKYKNNVSSIFLLSDGHDSQAVYDVEKQINIVKDPFTLHTFGFGDRHDAKLMTSLCNLKNGSFYFVQDITLLDEFFVDALGGLISVIGEEVKIQVLSNPDQPYQDIKISKTYGNMWKQNNQSYEIDFPQLISGTRKDFVFEIQIPQFMNNINNQQVKIIDAKLTIKNPLNGEIIEKLANLSLTFYNPDQEMIQIDTDPDVQTQYFRVKGTEAIDDARKACEQNKFEDAQARINHILIQIQQNKIANSLCAGIIQDLDQAKQASMITSYKTFGQKQMYQMVTNNYLQGGINSIFTANGKQLQQKQPAHYQNRIQQIMMSKVQNQKSRQHY